MNKLIAVIRIRGTVNVPKAYEDTLKMLRLHKPNHMRIIKATSTIIGMIKKVESYITWGEIDLDVLEQVFTKRGEVIGGKKLTNEIVKEKLGLSGIREFAEKVFNGEIDVNKIKWFKPVFRLTPPSGGFKKSVKSFYSSNGELGYRGREINKLIVRMI
ncbi:MAG: 50S ribosomal protein L30 [Candidatus Methanomethylicia archaeon]|nr:50S ribosomal protein L30 [Candidatus Methanomethylicia archaeon]MCX8168962.1 50S ribosomal protein L30 [Candidatus Methanomethylicia archaeon]MDW7988694.1 50S ribosomal protein L30 [Nitrososphaerota archaeon]